MDFHLILHSVCVVILATFITKYFYLSYQNEHLEILYDSCMNHMEGKYAGKSKAQTSKSEIEYEYVSGRPTLMVSDKTLQKFQPSQEMEYFEKYLGIKSQNPESDVDIKAYESTNYRELSSTSQISSFENGYSMLSVNDGIVHHTDFTKSLFISDVVGSVMCSGFNHHQRICHFHNLCYNTEYGDFIIFVDSESVFENVPIESHNILDMSSVADHNLHYFSLLKLPTETYNQFKSEWIKQPSLIFNRFKPDNIMHVLHDDILPLYHTLKQLTFDYSHYKNNKFNIQLVTMEGWQEQTEFDFLYKLFSTNDILTKKSLRDMSELVCFSNAHVGLTKLSTWYQYGFYKPQGPLPSITVTAFHINNTVNHILANINTFCALCDLAPYLVLFSRKDTRKIINENELIMSIAQHVGLKVMPVSLETNSLVEIINLVYKSKGVIGMHGSLLILSLFLQPGSILIELFPFAVNPLHYTPYKTLANIPHMGIFYEAWVNENREHTVMHPEWSPELGGISHLKEKEEIMNQKEIPPHLCCEDPSWLFHIYQDTIVDIDVIIKLIKKTLSRNSKKPYQYFKQLVAGPVIRLICHVSDESITVSWQKPWNIKYIPHNTIEFEVMLYNSKINITSSFLLSNITTYSIPIESDSSYLVWVKCYLDELPGLISHVVVCK